MFTKHLVLKLTKSPDFPLESFQPDSFLKICDLPFELNHINVITEPFTKEHPVKLVEKPCRAKLIVLNYGAKSANRNWSSGLQRQLMAGIGTFHQNLRIFHQKANLRAIEHFSK